MSTFNTPEIKISTFFLFRIPGLEHANIWVSIIICFMYLVAILGNCTILFFIKSVISACIHELLSFYAGSLWPRTVHLLLRIILFNSPRISSDACFAQVFTDSQLWSNQFVSSCPSIALLPSATLWDTPLTSARVTSIAFSFKNALLILPFPFTVKHLRNSKKNLLFHSYCLHQGIIKLACSDNK